MCICPYCAKDNNHNKTQTTAKGSRQLWLFLVEMFLEERIYLDSFSCVLWSPKKSGFPFSFLFCECGKSNRPCLASTHNEVS